MEFLLIFWLGASLLLIAYYIFYAWQLSCLGGSIPATNLPLSVIICAHNEKENLKQYLPSILRQDYRQFEVLVILDRCRDGSEELLQSWQAEYPQLRFLNFEGSAQLKGKKGALRYGLENCRYEQVVLTDADCEAGSDQWLACMGGKLENAEVVLGYGAYRKQPGWINQLVQWETLHAATHYLALANYGKPFMGVGRNLAYHKTTFLESDRFASHAHLISGDDDLFISALKDRRVLVETRPRAQTVSRAPQSFSQWYRQKRRHLSTALHYSPFHQSWLGLYALAQGLFITGAIVLSFSFGNEWWFWLLILLKLLVQLSLLYPLAKRLEVSLSWHWPFMESLYVIFAGIISFQNIISKPRKWK